MLVFDGAWRFDFPGEIASGVVGDFFDLVGQIAAQFPSRQGVLEHFKRYFAASASESDWHSSNLRFAESDLQDYMSKSGGNAPLFIEAFYDACLSLYEQYPDITIPGVARINRVLYENEAGYEVAPPNLIFCNPQPRVPVPARLPSFRQQAQEAFQELLASSEKALAEGHPRQAVSELLWLLETIATAFRGVEVGDGTVGEKYFNPIVSDLKRYGGNNLKPVLAWIESLHGYLSSRRAARGGSIGRSCHRPERRALILQPDP